MNHAEPFTAAILRASSGGYAGLAASRLIEGEAGAAASAAEGFEAWKAHFNSLLLQLAAAVEDGLPGQFGERVAWSRDALAARGLPTGVLVTAMRRLKEVLDESLATEARATLAPYFERAGEELGRTPQPAPPEPRRSDAHSELAADYVTALLAGDEPGAVALILAALDSGRVTLPDTLERVLVPAQTELGRRWHLGEVTVAEEHFATVCTRKLLARLLARATPGAPNGRTVVVTAVRGDEHELGVLLVAAFFELDGWHTICLGTNTPAEDLARIAARFDADVVAIGATLDTQREDVARAIAALRAIRPQSAILVGGAAFAGGERLWQRLGADAYAASAADAVRVGRELAGC